MKIINIVYGASVVGEILFRYLKEKNIEVECFCDNNPLKLNSSLLGKPILSFSECCARYSEINFYIAMNDVKYADNQIKTSVGKTIVFTYTMIDEILQRQNAFSSELQSDEHIIKYMLETCLLSQKYYKDDDKLYVRTLQLLVTERCSLKCAECSNLIQYYEEPRDCDYELLKRTVDVIAEKFDEVNDIHLIGGEPFMNKRIFDIIAHIITKTNIHNIIIFTNGTIVPSVEQIQILHNDRIIINISNYGSLSRNIEKLKNVLKENSIHYNVYDNLKWNKHSEVQNYNLSLGQQISRFKECRSAVNCIEIGDGKLFRCFYANHAYRLRAVPKNVNEYLDVLNSDVTKKEIFDFLYKKEIFAICNWCNGMNFSDGKLPPAQQTKKSLKYEKYEYTD